MGKVISIRRLAGYARLDKLQNKSQEPHSHCQSDGAREQIEGKKEERITMTEAIEDEWAVVNAAPKRRLSWSDMCSKSQAPLLTYHSDIKTL